MNDRIETAETLANALVETLFDPKEKTPELRNAKRATARDALLASIAALSAMAYASEAYLSLLSPETGEKSSGADIGESLTDVLA